MPSTLDQLGDGPGRLAAKDCLTLEADSDVTGVGDIILKTSGVERARIAHNGTGTGLFGDPAVGGDLTGTVAAATVAKIQGHAASSATPAQSDGWWYDNVAGLWVPGTQRDRLAAVGRGLKAEAYSILAASGTNAPGSQNRRAIICGFKKGDVITNLVFGVAQAAAGTVPTSIFAALYSGAGVSLAVSANLKSSAIWTSTGYAVAPLSAPYTITADGDYYIVFLQDGTFGSTALTLGVAFLASNAFAQAIGSGHRGSGIDGSKTELTSALSLGDSTIAIWAGWN